MSAIASLTEPANHPIKTSISKIDKVKSRLFSLVPRIVAMNYTRDPLRGGGRASSCGLGTASSRFFPSPVTFPQ